MLAQLIIFLVVFISLSVFVFYPLKKLFVVREGCTNGYLKEAEEVNAGTALLKEEYLKKMDEAKGAGHRLKEEIRQTALREESEIEAKARKGAEDALVKAEAELNTIKAETWTVLEKDVPKLAELIVKRALE